MGDRQHLLHLYEFVVRIHTSQRSILLPFPLQLKLLQPLERIACVDVASVDVSVQKTGLHLNKKLELSGNKNEVSQPDLSSASAYAAIR